ncbi:hypothetical protein [Micromonospora carbonacea]|uniref:Uncharacterized protein n=1 Tax=Micromonospora carbonacea TaxID=47853 RepID=A0A1C5ACQ4_9ACTN|nr:hypothetical protein [Micromonospora carbonacea]SCF42804.1 hypothetical protein GA0070563_112133 [Micromonospora carbonacea]
MSNDPHRVPSTKILASLRDLGLNPVDPDTLHSVTINHRGVEVVRARLNEDGHPYSIGGNQIATETVLIAVDHDT